MSLPAAETPARDADLTDLRRVHLGMADAALAGGGVERVATLAARELGGTVAIVLPPLDIAVAAPPVEVGRLQAAARHGFAAAAPAGIAALVPVHSGDERMGAVLLLGDDGARPEARDVLELAALSALTAVALRDARVTRRRAAAELLEDLGGPTPPALATVLSRARQLGSDLAAGAFALCVRAPGADAERALARIAQEVHGAVAAVRADTVAALLPAAGVAQARRLARRLAQHAPVGLSPLEPDPARLGAALREAELALVVAEREGVDPPALWTTSWRLMLRAAARDPDSVRAAVAGTVEPILAHGRTELLDTLRAYLDADGNMNAAATRVFAHRHTVAHRLRAIRELTGLDPQTGAGKAELALGLKALVTRDALAALDGAPPRARLHAA